MFAEHSSGFVDRAVRWLGVRRFPTVYLFWIVALFIVADVVAYRATS